MYRHIHLAGRGLKTLAALSLLAAGACQNEMLEIPSEEQYIREFVKTFGVPDPDETWNSAKSINGHVETSSLPGAQTVEVLTGWPGASDAYLLARYDAADAASFSFDAPQGLKSAYVRVLNESGRVLAARYVALNDAELNMTTGADGTGGRSYLYDLTDSPAFGSALVTDGNKSFWLGYTNNEGKTVYSDTPVQTHYSDKYYQLDVRYKDDDADTESEMPEGGMEVGNWNRKFEVAAPGDLTPPSNGTSYKIRLTVKCLEGEYSQLQVAPNFWRHPSEVWTSYQNISLSDSNYEIGVESTCEFELKGQDAEDFCKDGCLIQGENALLSKVEFMETGAGTPGVNYKDIFRIYGLTEAKVSDHAGYMSSYLKPDNSYDPVGYRVKDIVSLVGKNGVFNEEIDENNECNLDKYRTELNLDKGVEYRVTADSKVGVNFFYGCASFYNSLGYFYYDESEANDVEALLRKPKFILISNAYPLHNLKFQQEEGGGFVSISQYSTCEKNDGWDNGHYNQYPHDEGKDMCDNWSEASTTKRLVDAVDPAVNGAPEPGLTGRIQSAYYPLTYYQLDNEGKPIESTATKTFPAGTHIAFFVILNGHYWIDKNGTSTQNIDHTRLAFSLPQLNDAIGNTFHTSHTHSWVQGEDGNNAYSKVDGTSGAEASWTPFASYLWNGSIIMGVEDMPGEKNHGGVYDGGDHDMNDLLFQVSGDVDREDDKELNEDPTKTMKWIIACEDLGSTDDFDFNDVVIGVSHVSGQETATVTALAAGGTLPVYLTSKYPQVVDGREVTNTDGVLYGEFHTWWGPNRPSSGMINTTSYEGEGATVTIRVPKNFSLATALDPDGAHVPTHGLPKDGNMGGFKVIVEKDGGRTETIEAPEYDPANNALSVPQMFLVPAEWNWPMERRHIHEVYPDFVQFGDGWWKNPQGRSLIVHGWK